jgi:hypothetical protein
MLLLLLLRLFNLGSYFRVVFSALCGTSLSEQLIYPALPKSLNDSGALVAGCLMARREPSKGARREEGSLTGVLVGRCVLIPLSLSCLIVLIPHSASSDIRATRRYRIATTTWCGARGSRSVPVGVESAVGGGVFVVSTLTAPDRKSLLHLDRERVVHGGKMLGEGEGDCALDHRRLVRVQHAGCSGRPADGGDGGFEVDRLARAGDRDAA